jgi:hypothetical protein
MSSAKSTQRPLPRLFNQTHINLANHLRNFARMNNRLPSGHCGLACATHRSPLCAITSTNERTRYEFACGCVVEKPTAN